MTGMTQTRVDKGIPAGGQFSSHDRAEATMSLQNSWYDIIDLPLNPGTVDAAVLAAAGEQHSYHVTDQANFDAHIALTYRVAAATGSEIVIVDENTTVADLRGTDETPGLLELARDNVLLIEHPTRLRPGLLRAIAESAEAAGSFDTTTMDEAGNMDMVSTRIVMVGYSDPCGNPSNCVCTSAERRRHGGRIDGTMSDRMSVVTRANAVGKARTTYTKESARETVAKAKAAASTRLAGTPWKNMRDVSGSWLREGDRRLDSSSTMAMDRALERGGITMRGYDRVLRNAWTAADMDGVVKPTKEHVERALHTLHSS